MKDNSQRLAKRTLALEKELARQWIVNHAEHCGIPVPPWPHPGDCQWPMPEVLSQEVTGRVCRLLQLP
jgi:hypothetical protein